MASRANSVYEAARRPDFQAPAGWGPLVLSVFERPQRLLTYIQPTSPGARCRPIHVGRVADGSLTTDDFVLDRVAGARFIGSLDGWIPGHEKIIYASYSGASLTAFARRAVEDFGRGTVPGIVEDGFYLRELEASLAKSGARELSAGFYIEAAKRGVFFHFSGLSRETRRLMAYGYRRFSPLPCEPFILCATETISYGVNLPADALFLENISWPRSRYRHCYSIEALTANEFRNLVGRVGRYGHIKPGVIPTVVVNWPLGRSVSSRAVFEERRKALAEIASSTPASEIDCRDLQGHLLKPTALKLSDYPGPVGRFYLLALLHASKAAGGGPVTAGQATEFLSETYTVRSLFRGGDGGRPGGRGGLLSGLSGFLDHLSREFGNLVVDGTRSKSGRRYLPGSLCSNLARNDTSPYTLKELDRLLSGMRGGAEGAAPGTFGLRTLLAAPLLTEMRYVFTRVFADPRMLTQGALKRARTDPGDADRWFRRASAPVEWLLAAAGLSPEEARSLCGSVRSAGRATVERHLRENFRRASRNREATAFLRDAFLEKVLSTIRTLLMWIGGSPVKSILSVGGSGLLAASPDSAGEDGDGAGGSGGEAGKGRENREDLEVREGLEGQALQEAKGLEDREGPGDRGGTEEREAAVGRGSSEGSPGPGREGGGADGEGADGEGAALPGPGADARAGRGQGNGPENPKACGFGDCGQNEPGNGAHGVTDAGAPEDSGEREESEDPGGPGGWEGREGSGPWLAAPRRRLKGGVDTHSFNQRYCDKTALVMDSYLAYCQAAAVISPEEALSLQTMGERVRWGLREEDLEPFNRDRKERGMGREEWLARAGGPVAVDGG
jgi:hypothetical protein